MTAFAHYAVTTWFDADVNVNRYVAACETCGAECAFQSGEHVSGDAGNPTNWMINHARLHERPDWTPPVDAREKMREVIEAMRPIVEAAISYSSRFWPRETIDFNSTVRIDPNRLDAMLRVVEQHRDGVAAALSAWADSQTLSEAEKLRAENERMRAVCEAAEDWMARGYQNKADTPLMVAVDAYRAARSKP